MHVCLLVFIQTQGLGGQNTASLLGVALLAVYITQRATTKPGKPRPPKKIH